MNTLEESLPNPRRQSEIIRMLNQKNFIKPPILSFEQDASILSFTKDLGLSQSKIFDYQFIAQKQLKHILKLQRAFRNLFYRKSYILMRKIYRYRKNIIDEIINTEEAYVRDLNIVQDECILSLKQYIPQEQLNKLFSNLKEIRELNYQVLQLIKKEYENYFPYKVIFKSLLNILPFYKIYFFYCNDYDKGRKIRQQLLGSNTVYREFILQLEKKSVMHGIALEDILVKPIQRLPKYVLLFKDLLKHTETSHPDYTNIQQCLIEFEKLNEENNKAMDIFLNSAKMFEIQRQFGDPNQIQIFQLYRTFVMEETLSLYRKQKDPWSVVCYFLSDCMVITEQSKLYKILYLNETSQIKSVNDQKYYQNMFKVVGKNDLETFLADNAFAKQKCVDALNEIIFQIRQQKQQQVQNLNRLNTGKNDVPKITVTILGTEEHNVGSLSQYTVYIIEIKHEKITQKIFPRYSEIRSFRTMIKQRRIDMKLPQFSNIDWLRNHQTELLENRKIEIENFLQIVLDEPEIQNDTELLKFLGLPQNFFQLYQLIDNDDIYKQKSSKTTSFLSNLDSKERDLRPQHVQLEEKFNHKLYETQLLEGSKSITAKITVRLINNESFVIEVGIEMRAIQVCEIIGNCLGMQQYFDFKLFIVDQKQNQRLIEDEQLLLRSIPKDQSLIWVDERKGWSKIFSVFNMNQHVLQFKKYITFPLQIENIFNKSDKVRLKLMAQQYLDDIKNKRYVVSFSDSAKYASLYLFINQLDICNKFPHEEVKNFLGSRLYKLFPSSEWKYSITLFTNQLDKKLEEILNINQQISKNRPYQTDASDLLNKIHLAQLVIVNMIQSIELYGTTLFYVVLSKKLLQNKSALRLTKNIYLGVNCKEVILVRPTKDTITHRFRLNSLTNIHAFPNSFAFVADSLQIKIKTIQSYQIHQLIRQYIEIADFIQ